MFFSLTVLACLVNFCLGLSFASLVSSFGLYFVVDSVSFYLSFLSIALGGVLFFVFNFTSWRSCIMIGVSVVSSVVCYMSVNVVLFWIFYEVSILSLFFLLVADSPYSERYIAGWYLLGYVVLTSLPMLLCLVFLTVLYGSCSMVDWGTWGFRTIDYLGLMLVLGVMFVTKVPVPPFHVWLPIVHAEASSVVSVCLSGYIMKLGLLGVGRICYYVVPEWLFSSFYVVVAFSLASLFFLSAARELDGKRWLAFLSLAHIMVCVVCFYALEYNSAGLVFLYSLGHGLSAGLLFIFLWWAYELSGSRNWFVLKSVLGGSRLFCILLAASLCTAASLPPTVQFFVEVGLLSELVGLSLLVCLFLLVYLFVGSLVPVFLLGSLVSRHLSVGCSDKLGLWGFFGVILYLILWSFVVFLFV